jgi:hypothetical protein
MFKKLFEKEKINIRKYKPVFITVDGKEHEGPEYNWIIINRLKCSAPEYIMIDVTSDGYLRDKKGIMYILSNIISIDWQVVEKREVEDNYSDVQVYINNLD